MLLNELYIEYNGTAHMSKEPVAPFQICLGNSPTPTRAATFHVVCRFPSTVADSQYDRPEECLQQQEQ